MKVLLSIKPEYVEQIFNGTKKFEYRKSIFKDKSVTQIIVYSTMPVGKIVGEFSIEEILSDEPKAIWFETKEHSGVQKRFFEEYFKGRKNAYAIKIANPSLYDIPIDPKELNIAFTPPQSFMYINTAKEMHIQKAEAEI